MAERKIQQAKEDPSDRQLVRGESRKLVTDDGRRNRFKGRAKDLERGVSAPNFYGGEGEESPKTAPKAPLPLNAEEAVTVGQGLGHSFAKKTFFHPTYCQFCSELLWGIKGQGFLCAICNYAAHEKCIPSLTIPCRHILADMIQDPVPHRWTCPTQMKKKPFCNVCRKKISHEGLLCEVCKFYSHTYCQDLAFHNCKQCATYSYNTPSDDTHYWIEGNLPSSARCQVCTKACASNDCLTGFRCGWCGIAVHSKCLEKYKQTYPKCTFRDLWGMILVPRAVSHRKVGGELCSSPTTPNTADSCSPSALEGTDEQEEDTDGGKGKPCIVIDGSSSKGFKRWRKATVHPTYLHKKMTAQELLTPMNMASTRSHCIFTIHLSAREPGADTIRRAKLHLVDLAGSERVLKSGIGGSLLAEAKFINSSLFFLEQVIVALSERSRTHIPYRNSMMTSVLRDSLGGNCMTTMIATCAVEKKNVDETISTCRFAQRVALVKNDALVNEELDPKLMVVHLKQRVQELKDELVLATGQEVTDELTSEEKEKCEEMVRAYVGDPSPEATLTVGGDMRKIKFCFGLLKSEILKRSEVSSKEPAVASPAPDNTSTTTQDPSSSSSSRDHTQVFPTAAGSTSAAPRGQGSPPGGGVDPSTRLELEMLQTRLHQRDGEIRVLLRMMKQERKRADRAEAALSSAGGRVGAISPASPDRLSPLRLARGLDSEGGGGGGGGERERRDGDSVQRSSSCATPIGSDRSKVVSNVSGSSSWGALRSSVGGAGEGPVGGVAGSSSQEGGSEWKAALKAELSRARQEAFDAFRKKYSDTSAIEHHKKVLKVKYAEAKSLGERVNNTRLHINKLKSQIEKYRVARGLRGPGNTSAATSDLDQREEQLKKEMESEKERFKVQYNELRGMKTEIEHVQHLLQKAKVKVQREFEEWWKRESEAVGPSSSTSTTSSSTTGPPRAAWYTPPPASASSTQGSSAQSRAGTQHRPRRHQVAIAAQFSHQKLGNGSPSSPTPSPHARPPRQDQHPSPSNFSPPTNHVEDKLPPGTRNQGAADRTTEEATIQGSLYRDSWQQADSLSPPKPRPRPLLEGGAANSPADGREQYLTKKQQLSSDTREFGSRIRPSGSEGGGVGVQGALKEHQSVSPQSSIPLTGDPKADADILAFYKARQKLIRGFR